VAEWITPKTDWKSEDFLNYTDLNRIENNSRYLSDILLGYGYHAEHAQYENWQVNHFPFSSEMERIRRNIKNIKQNYFAKLEVPATLEGLDYEKLNAMEQILLEAYEAVKRMISAFQYCGDIYTGGF